LKTESLPQIEWKKGYKRTGVIARKLGNYQLWLKNGTKISTTVLQVVDNHVIKYIPPGVFEPSQKKPLAKYDKSGCLLVGSEPIDPNLLTANYIGLFKDSGVMPKRNLSRFLVSPQAALLPGTQLNATHFKVGDHVDVRGKT
jgi:large subunit ribosomal protein L3